MAAKRAWTQQDKEAGVGQTLQPYDWIQAGLDLLIERGIGAVRITQLAEQLGVTRGSFYWHFRDRAHLLDALIAHWRDKNTQGIVAAVEEAGGLEEGLLALFAVWVDGARFEPRLDSALREWARRDTKIRRAVEDADSKRIEAIAKLFRDNGYDRKEAWVRARVIYFGQVGYYAMAIEETLMARLDTLEIYFRVFTGRPLSAARARQFRRTLLARSAAPRREKGLSA